MGQEAGQVVDEDEEEDWTHDRPLWDTVRDGKRSSGASADELGAVGEVASEPAG